MYAEKYKHVSYVSLISVQLGRKHITDIFRQQYSC